MTARKKTEEARASAANLELEQLERVLEFMVQHGLEEFEYRHGDLQIRLRRAMANSNASAGRFVPPEIVVAQPVPPPAVPGAGPAAGPALESPAAPAEPSVVEELHLIKSPIVGTFYESPAPDAEPFVRVGDHVEPGQVLCIIEAMKLMNEIESDVAGEIIRIHVENGQPVEYGQPLFSIRPTRKK
ncbi:MAG: acetyl-CoA carboxylase biotin carboxyl carrier protein [Firmicutes bacterium]|nr:acetyl-CoA carboxylase biotin carboxyl carrier protein [Bacillota bacterium]